MGTATLFVILTFASGATDTATYRYKVKYALDKDTPNPAFTLGQAGA